MACIFNTVLLDLTAAITDSFEGRGAYSRGGGAYWRIYGRFAYWKTYRRSATSTRPLKTILDIYSRGRKSFLPCWKEIRMESVRKCFRLKSPLNWRITPVRLPRKWLDWSISGFEIYSLGKEKAFQHFRFSKFAACRLRSLAQQSNMSSRIVLFSVAALLCLVCWNEASA